MNNPMQQCSPSMDGFSSIRFFFAGGLVALTLSMSTSVMTTLFDASCFRLFFFSPATAVSVLALVATFLFLTFGSLALVGLPTVWAVTVLLEDPTEFELDGRVEDGLLMAGSAVLVAGGAIFAAGGVLSAGGA